MTDLPGRRAALPSDGDLRSLDAIPAIFDELDYQFASQVHLWALPLVSYAPALSAMA